MKGRGKSKFERYEALYLWFLHWFLHWFISLNDAWSGKRLRLKSTIGLFCCFWHISSCCRAVVDHSVGKDLPSIFVESFEYFPGRGLTATVNGVKVRLSYLLDSYIYPFIYQIL